MDRTSSYDDAYSERSPLFGVAPTSALVRVVESLDLRGGTALDIGSGDGRESLFLLDLGFHVDALDRSHEALEGLRRRVARERLDESRIKTIETDVVAYSAPERSYDLIVATTVLDHLVTPDLDELQPRLLSWLRVGGVAYFEVYTSRDPSYVGGEKVSEFASEIRHHFEPNELLDRFSPDLSIVLYEELPEWDRDHGPVHMHYFARLAGVVPE